MLAMPGFASKRIGRRHHLQAQDRDRGAFVDGVDRIDDAGGQGGIERAGGELLHQRVAGKREHGGELDVLRRVVALLEAHIDRPMGGRDRADEADGDGLGARGRRRRGRGRQQRCHEGTREPSGHDADPSGLRLRRIVPRDLGAGRLPHALVARRYGRARRRTHRCGAARRSGRDGWRSPSRGRTARLRGRARRTAGRSCRETRRRCGAGARTPACR